MVSANHSTNAVSRLLNVLTAAARQSRNHATAQQTVIAAKRNLKTNLVFDVLLMSVV